MTETYYEKSYTEYVKEYLEKAKAYTKTQEDLFMINSQINMADEKIIENNIKNQKTYINKHTLCKNLHM